MVLRDCPEIADHFTRLVSAVSSVSFQLNKDQTFSLSPDFNIHPYLGNDCPGLYKSFCPVTRANVFQFGQRHFYYISLGGKVHFLPKNVVDNHEKNIFLEACCQWKEYLKDKYPNFEVGLKCIIMVF